jgi:hypothetical protein
MAENIGFNVKVGMDVAEMQSELQKAQNLLREFQSQLKKSTNTIEINMLNNEIKTLTTQIDAYGQALNKAGKPVGDATQSLLNFSRIAQDAPYGIIGIANNLNPMLESFDRLAKTEGGTKKALMAMVQGLSGPAGVGVALGIVSSLAVVFSKKISEAFGNSADKLKTFREELNKLNAEIYKIAGGEQANLSRGGALVDLITGKGSDTTKTNAINELKKLYSDSKEIQDIDINNQKNYSKELLTQYINRAAAQNFAIGLEKNNLASLKVAESKYKELQDKIRIEQEAITKPLYTTTSEGKQIITRTIQGQQDDIVKGYKKSIDDAKYEIAKYSSKEGGLLGSVLGFATPDKKTATSTDNTLQDSFKEIVGEGFASERLRRNMKGEDLSLIFLDTPESVVAKEKKRLDSIKDLLKPIIDSMASETGFGGLLMKKAAIDAPKYKAEEAEKKRQGEETIREIREQEQAYKQFANTIATDVTGALSAMYDAMQKGENPFKAISDMLSRLAEELVATAIKAAIFSAIISALGGGSAAVAGNGGKAATGFFDIFKQLLGIGVTKNAAGGITNGPSLGLIGEAGPEAIMPLSKLSSFLNTSFNAGAMSGSSTGNGGQFVLRGQDLLLAVNRTQKASNLKGQSISLA